MTRPINAIAADIVKAWGPSKIYFGARPYLDAMHSLSTKSDRYFEDDAKSIVLYFLANASAFRGEAAKELKAELKSAIA